MADPNRNPDSKPSPVVGLLELHGRVLLVFLDLLQVVLLAKVHLVLSLSVAASELWVWHGHTAQQQCIHTSAKEAMQIAANATRKLVL